MIEILVLIALTKKIGSIVEAKGRKSGWYKVMAVVFWFGGEVIGALIGASLSSGDTLATYAIAIVGAAIGAGAAYLIANGLKGGQVPLGAGGLPGTPVSSIPLPLLFVLWMITNILYSFLWSWFFKLFNPTFADSQWTSASIATELLAGAIIGTLQWLILIYVIPNARRGFLALWIPATMAGMAIGEAIYAFVKVPASLDVLLSILGGLVLGFSQWLLLRRVAKAAIWWIPAIVVDYLASWLLSGPIYNNVSNFTMAQILVALVGSIASCFAIVFILKDTLAQPHDGTGPVIEALDSEGKLVHF